MILWAVGFSHLLAQGVNGNCLTSAVLTSKKLVLARIDWKWIFFASRIYVGVWKVGGWGGGVQEGMGCTGVYVCRSMLLLLSVYGYICVYVCLYVICVFMYVCE